MKRSHDTCEIKYAVMETMSANSLKLQFMPQIWLVPARGSTLKERDVVKYFFPVRLHYQSEESFLSFVKQAKFNCVKPKKDGKWEVYNGRILKMDLGTIEEAINIEKLYSDYFSTIDTEPEVPPPEPKKRVQKKKKAPVPKVMNYSESEDENAEVSGISNYNDQFGMGTQVMNQASNGAQGSCCKGHQKVMNKLDYVNKKISKEVSLLRQETAGNRKLLVQVLSLLQPGQNEANHEQTGENQDEQAQLNVAEIDCFNEKYKATFPIKDCDFIIDFNKSMKDDQQFVNGLFSKLSKIKGDDEAKTARKILKELCHFRCLKDFTWEGTKKGMKSFQNLHLIVELITKLLTEKYPGCEALEILKKVVQQRTKSAKEAFDKVKLTDQKVESSAALDSEQSAAAAGSSATNLENNLMTTESEKVVSTVNTTANERDGNGSSD